MDPSASQPVKHKLLFRLVLGANTQIKDVVDALDGALHMVLRKQGTTSTPPKLASKVTTFMGTTRDGISTSVVNVMWQLRKGVWLYKQMLVRTCVRGIPCWQCRTRPIDRRILQGLAKKTVNVVSALGSNEEKSHVWILDASGQEVAYPDLQKGESLLMDEPCKCMLVCSLTIS